MTTSNQPPAANEWGAFSPPQATTHRDLRAILADLADFTVASTREKALSLYHELEDAVSARLAPLPEGETDTIAAEAERAARAMAPPVPGVTRHNDYIIRAVIYNHAHANGYLEAWWIAGEDPCNGHWVTWNAYAGDPAGSRAGRLSYDGGHYFESTSAADNKRMALADLAERAGLLPEVARMAADEMTRKRYGHTVTAEDKRAARGIRRYFAR
jgi:hypothetical protein